MIDNVDNAIQITVLVVCAVVSFVHAVTSRGMREWILLGLFYGAAFAGTLYWMLYVALYKDASYNPFIAYLSWNTSYYFLILLVLYMKGGKSSRILPLYLLLIPIFTIGMCMYYVTFGSLVNNIITLILMTALLWSTSDGLLLIRSGDEENKGKRAFYLMVFVFCFVEYLLWTSSCIWSGSVITNPYYLIDVMFSASYILFIPAMRKAAGR